MEYNIKNYSMLTRAQRTNKVSKRDKIKAMQSMDTQLIASAFADKPGSHWYNQFAIHQEVLQPVYSNMVNILTDSVVDIVYNKKVSNELFSFKDLKRIEKHLQLYGDVVVLVHTNEQYMNLEKNYEIELIPCNHVGITKANGLDYLFEVRRQITDKITLLEIWNKATMEKINILMDGEDQIPLNSIKETADLQDLEKLDVFPIYKLTTDNKIRHCLDQISVLDGSLSLQNLAQISNIPTLMIPNDINLNDEEATWIFNNQVEVVRAKLNGIFKIDYDGTSESYNAPSYQQTEVKIDIFQLVADNVKKEIFNTMKLSPSTLGMSSLGASASADALKQENLITKNTRDSYAIERQEQLNSICLAYGVDELRFPSFLEEENPADLLNDLNNKAISDRTYLELRFPHWSDERIDEELSRKQVSNQIDLENMYNS